MPIHIIRSREVATPRPLSEMRRKIKSLQPQLISHYSKLIQDPDNSAATHWKMEILTWLKQAFEAMTNVAINGGILKNPEVNRWWAEIRMEISLDLFRMTPNAPGYEHYRSLDLTDAEAIETIVHQYAYAWKKAKNDGDRDKVALRFAKLTFEAYDVLGNWR